MNRAYIYAASALLLTACLDGRDPSKTGTPAMCGAAPIGGACNATEDCSCNLTCALGTCIQVFNPPQAPVVNVGTPTSEIRQVCAKFEQIPCAEAEPDCVEEGAEARAEAEAAGCVTEFDAFVRCALAAPNTCDGQNVPSFFTQCVNEFEAQQACDCTPTRVCGSSDPRPSPLDAGTSTTTPTQTCYAEVSQSCDRGTGSAAIECSQVATSNGTIWVCTCEEGARIGATFGVRSTEDCCEFAEMATDRCGLQ